MLLLVNYFHMRCSITQSLPDLHWTDESLNRLRPGSCPRLIVPRTRLSTIGDQSFRVLVARAWNSLPTNITASTSLMSFKKQLITKSFPSLYTIDVKNDFYVFYNNLKTCIFMFFGSFMHVFKKVFL